MYYYGISLEGKDTLKDSGNRPREARFNWSMRITRNNVCRDNGPLRVRYRKRH